MDDVSRLSEIQAASMTHELQREHVLEDELACTIGVESLRPVNDTFGDIDDGDACGLVACQKRAEANIVWRRE